MKNLFSIVIKSVLNHYFSQLFDRIIDLIKSQTLRLLQTHSSCEVFFDWKLHILYRLQKLLEGSNQHHADFVHPWRLVKLRSEVLAERFARKADLF